MAQKCVGRVPSPGTRPRHRFVGLVALRGDDKARNNPPPASPQVARAIRRAVSVIRRRFGADSIRVAADLMRGRAAP
jgi:hypothetical protein